MGGAEVAARALRSLVQQVAAGSPPAPGGAAALGRPSHGPDEADAQPAVGNLAANRPIDSGLSFDAGLMAGVNGAVVGGVAGLTLGMGAAAMGVAPTALSVGEAFALGSLAGPVSGLAGIAFKGITNQPITAGDGFGAILNMVPLPSKLGPQLAIGILFDQIASAFGSARNSSPGSSSPGK